MRILLVCPIPPDPRGAGAIPRLLHALVAELAARHGVTLAAVAGPDAESLDALARLRREGVDVVGEPRYPGVEGASWRRRRRILHRLVRHGDPWRAAWFHDPAMDATLRRITAERPFDVMHVEDSAAGGYSLCGLPSLLTEHEVRTPRAPRLAALSTPRGALAELDWLRWRGFQRRTWRRFDALQAFTERDRAAMERIAPETVGRISVNPFSITMPARIDPLRERAGQIVFMGNYSHLPNVDAAVWLARDILPLVRRTRPDARLELVGPEAPPQVRALAGGPVTVTGRVDDTRSHFARAAVVVAPVRIGGGMRMKVLEAMAYGKAVVTTRRGLEGLDGAPAAAADTAEEVSAHIVRLLGSPSDRRRMGAEARRFVESSYGPAAHVDRLERAYDRAIAAHGRFAP